MEEILTVLFWIGFLCCLPLVAVGGPIAFVLYRNRQRREGSAAIGAALGLQPTARAKQMQWYEGRLANGRLAAYLPIIFQRRTNHLDGRSRSTHDSAARLIVEVKRQTPLGVDAFRHEKWRRRQYPLDTFDTAFAAKDGQRLTGRQQTALLEFARRNPGCTIWLRDREGASESVFNDLTIMSGALTFLMFEYGVVNPNPEEVQARMSELSGLARLFDE